MATRATQRDLRRLAGVLARKLRERSLRIVFAESCTGGLVSAMLTTVAGVSEHHCGSAVAYRLETKADWLGVAREQLHDPGPVSRAVAEAMAVGVLSRTPEANLAVSVTGHLGPNAPRGLDGVLYLSVAARLPSATPQVLHTQQVRLAAASHPSERKQPSLRRRRQVQAAAHALEFATAAVELVDGPGESAAAAPPKCVLDSR